MARNRLLASGLLLACLWTPAAADVVLAWQWEFQGGNPPWVLTIIRTADGATTQATRTLTTMDDGRCRQLLGTAYVEGESRCAALACPGAGAYQLVLQATELGEPSQPESLGIAGPPCAKVSYDDAVQRALPIALPAPLPPPAPLTLTPASRTPAAPPSAPDLERPGPVPLVTPAAPEATIPEAPPLLMDLPPESQAPLGIQDGPLLEPVPDAPAPGPLPSPVSADTPPAPPRPSRTRQPRRSARPMPPVPASSPAPLPVFADVPAPGQHEPEARTAERLTEAFTDLARQYGQAMDGLADEYNRMYDEVLAHPTPAGQRRLERLYQRFTQRQRQLYTQAQQAWERLYAAWQAFVATPPRPR